MPGPGRQAAVWRQLEPLSSESLQSRGGGREEGEVEREPEAPVAAGGGSSSRGSPEERGRGTGGSWGGRFSLVLRLGQS